MNKYDIYVEVCNAKNIKAWWLSKFYRLIKENSINDIVWHTSKIQKLTTADKKYINSLWIDKKVELRVLEKYYLKKNWPDKYKI